MYRIIDTSKYWATISFVSALVSVVFLAVWGLKLGIDFTGGSSIQLHFPDTASRPSIDEMSAALSTVNITDERIQTAGDTDLLIKLPYINNDQREQILQLFTDKGVTEQSFSTIGPTLGAELKHKAVTALLLVLLAIVAYISYAFRKVSQGPVPSWVFGLSAIIALAHDILLVLGVFSLLGHFFDVQIDSLFVTALLTILGFSVHDTIVVYDRIREGLKDRATKTFREIINSSINTTLARSLNTSLATLLVLLVLYLFGGESIHHFVFTLLIGIIFGTYSSIFIASPLLLVGQKILKK
ncbi:MAG: protein translocase subunit SecF [Candidatus Kerfeldbacteria bacterium]|nr:protein translocase subunit SecF [Candidatus Kerfeldbacteria bacterium]